MIFGYAGHHVGVEALRLCAVTVMQYTIPITANDVALASAASRQERYQRQRNGEGSYTEWGSAEEVMGDGAPQPPKSAPNSLIQN